MPTKTRSQLAPGRFSIGNKTLALSNLDKVLYPQAGFTKRQVIEYYAHVAPAMIPHLRDRPVTLKRYPDGVESGHFYEKSCPAYRPDWIKTGDVPSDVRGKIRYCLVNDSASLIWIANLASLEVHTLLCRVEDLTRPTFMVFDLDPGPGADILDCIRVGQEFRRILEGLKLAAFAKTSGGKGLHLYVPLNTEVTFDQTKSAARALAEWMQRQDSARITSNMRRDLRSGRVFIDWSQNDRHKTTAAAYSLRARPRPTVSTPVTWDELAAAVRKRRPLAFEADQVLSRIQKHGDLFAPVLTMKQKLPKELLAL